MKVLLLGGTGAMGAYLAEILAEKGNDVFVTTRSDRKASQGITYIKGNAHSEEFLKNVISEHYDAIADFMVYNTEEFKRRVDDLLAATEQYVFFSTSRVYSNADGNITEKTPRWLDVTDDQEFLSSDEYAITKARQEDILRKSGKKNWTIIRPYITYSNERLQLGVLEKEYWLYRALHGRSIVFSSDIASHLTTLTYGQDVSTCIANLIGNSTAYGEAVQIAGHHSMCWSDVLQLYVEVLERNTGNRPKVHMMDTSDEVKKALGTRYQIEYDRLYDRTFDSSLADELSGNKIDYTPMKEGLTRCLEEFLDGSRRFRTISWRYEGWADRVCGEHTPLKEIPTWKERVRYILYRYNLKKMR